MHRKLCLFFAVVLYQVISFNAHAEGRAYKWKKISGKWEIKKSCGSSSFLEESRAKTRQWGYSELINNNSIISENPLEKYSRIAFSMELADPTDNPVQMMAFFAARDYRYFHAFRFSGDREGIERVSLVRSREKDPKLPRNVKWNFIIEEKMSKEYPLEYNRNYRIDIRFQKKSVLLYIDKKRIASFISKEPLNSGRFGFSSRNAIIRISEVKVYAGNRIIFEDDFSEDTIKRIGVKAKRVKEKE
jgi:hypothetical protein